MKLRKFLLIILSALSLIALSVSLSACGFIEEILGGEPPIPPAEEQPEAPSDDPTADSEDPENPSGCSHEYGEWTDEINECTLRQIKRICALCGDTEYKFVIPNGHDYGEWADLVNSCTQHSQKRVCAVCQEEDFRYLTPNPHNYGEWTDLVNTCTIHTQKRVCADCNDTQINSLPTEGHKYGEWTDEINTCTQHTQKRICSVCLDEEQKSLPVAGHIYGGWIDEVKTCTTHLQKQTCSSCGDIKKRALKTQGHKYTNGVCDYCKQSIADGGNGELDKYNGSYGYDYFKENNLTAQQTLYERIDESARAFHISKDLNAEAVLQNGSTNYVVSRVAYNDLGLSKEQAISVWKTYKDDNPLYYWLSSELTYTSSQLNILAVEDYAQGEDRIKTNDFVYNKVSEYSRMLSVDDNAYRKALAFHDKIISVIDYAYQSNGAPQSADWAHNIIGVFEERGAVCEGYAKAFQLLLNYNGVKNIFVSGNGNGEEHAWNLVRLDDGEWYWCDLTWDDTPSWEWGISYYYFLVNDTQQVNWRDGGWVANNAQNFLDTHTPHTPQGTSIQFLYALPARAAAAYAEENGLTLRKTFTDGNSTYAVAGYNTVQLVRKEASSAATVPETVTHFGVTYTVISIGAIDAKGTFGSGMVFYGATSISIPKTVKFIWDNAMVCSTNSYITVDSQNEYFCSVDGVLFTKSMITLVSYPANLADEEYRIPEQTSRLAKGAFSFIKNLARLSVGKQVRIEGIVCWGVHYDNSLNTVSGGWYDIAYRLKPTEDTRIIVDEENPYFTADGEWLYNKNKTCAYCYFNRYAVTIEIPASVTSFDSRVFSNFLNLESFTVADGNTAFAVRDGILYNADFTKIIYIPNYLTGTVTLAPTITKLGGVGNITNFSNSYLTEINISATMQSLGSYSFNCPYRLQRINYGGTVAQWLAIEKAENWVYGTEKFVIVCADGTLDINGNLITQ